MVDCCLRDDMTSKETGLSPRSRHMSRGGGDTRMKLEKLFDAHVLTGVVIGALIGLHFPLDAYKGLLVILAVVMGLKVATSK